MAKPQAKFLAELRSRASSFGFATCHITFADLPDEVGNHLEDFVQDGYHGTMGWMEETLTRRRHPQSMWSEARSAIVLGMNYGPECDPLEQLEDKHRANISVYARNRDYHDVVKGKLKTLAGWVAAQTGEDVKVFVDTAPLMEKPLAARAGAGWQGKHTNLVSREFGSWLFLGVILSAANLPCDEPEIDHCGTCRACLDICPTDAFPTPYKLDARRCISYLTIEHTGPIPMEFRKAMGNRIYGCDDCLAVCPWNKFAVECNEAKLRAREDLKKPLLAELASLDDKAFREMFSGSPIKRIGRDRFLRNVMIAVGNSEDDGLLELTEEKLAEENPLVRGAAVWAFSQLATDTHFEGRRMAAEGEERDANVLREWKLDA